MEDKIIQTDQGVQRAKIQKYIKKILEALNLKGPHFKETPERVARLLVGFTNQEAPSLTNFPLERKGGMITIKRYVTWGYCPHHLLPVRYTLKIGYVPEKKVLGLSKLARIADYVMRTMPIQEEVPELIGSMILKAIKPKGVGVICEGEHLCMRMRGVESEHVEAANSFMSDLFLDDPKAREEFLLL